jgi:hypothetical protein
MSIYSILNNMETSDYICVAVIILSIVQVTPIKINPWTKIATIIGRALNTEVVETIKQVEATNKRYRILRFDDEIRHHTKHTEEHFNQILEDLHEYETYCDAHPHYMNNKAESAVRNIKQTYERCRNENSFLV